MATGRHEKDNMFYTNMVWAKKYFTRKSAKITTKRQNSVKGPTDPNSAKVAKSNIKLQNVPKNDTQ